VGGSSRSTCVAALGNVLMGDDAFGPWVAHALLAEFEFPPQVTVEELGTPGFDLLPYVLDLDALVLVDTVRSDAAPGTVRVYGGDELLRHAPRPRLSPHDPGVKEALLSAQFLGRAPRSVWLVGAVPLTTNMGIGLSAALRDAVPRAVAEVVGALSLLGHRPLPRAHPVRPAVWWEAQAGSPLADLG
jgi:hydrogenase maturation protease